MFTRKMKIVLLLFVLFCLADNANATPRWRILDSGAIEWQIDGRLPHYDHIEMSGLKVSAVLRYGVNGDGTFNDMAYVADDTQQYTCKPDATICN